VRLILPKRGQVSVIHPIAIPIAVAAIAIVIIDLTGSKEPASKREGAGALRP